MQGWAVWSAGLAALALLGGGPARAAEIDLESLRARALELVNAARAEHGLPALSPGSDLDEAAQAHAADMLERGYYAHSSPEGEDVRDRYLEAGGNRSNLVAENIAQCPDCDAAPGEAAVERLHQGWMESPGHRANILRRGIERFGFGVAAEERLFAVQTFAGPGMPPGLGPDEEPRPLAEEAIGEEAMRLLNAAREAEGAPPLRRSGALDQAARALLPEGERATASLGQGLEQALPAGERRAWEAVSAMTAGCTGCGAAPTRADLRFFRDQWLDSAQYRRELLDPGLSRLGFALRADGEGRKTAVAVLGQPR